MRLPLRPKKEHKQIVQHIMVMMKMKFDNWKKDTYREHERRIEDGRVGANNASVFAIGELLIRRPIDQYFQQQIIQSSLPVLCLSRPGPSYQLCPPNTLLSLSLSLGIFTATFFYFLKLFKFQSTPKQYIYIYIYNLIFWTLLSKILALSHTILHWFHSKSICISCKIA